MAITDNFVPNDTNGAASSLPVRYVSLTDDGAITIADGTVWLDKGTAIAATLDDPPTGMNGARLRIVAEQGAAHTITASSTGFNGAGSDSQLATFAGEVGEQLELNAKDGEWLVVNWQDIASSVLFSATS